MFEKHQWVLVNGQEVGVAKINRINVKGPEYEMMTDVTMEDGSFFQFWVHGYRGQGGLWYFRKPTFRIPFLTAFFGQSRLERLATADNSCEMIFQKKSLV